MEFQTINVSAPGKVILFGEHSVVYGKKALATSINIHTNLKLKETNDNFVLLIFPGINKSFKWNYEELQTLQTSVETFLSGHQNLYSQVDEELLSKLKSFVNQSYVLSTEENFALLSFFYLFLTIFYQSAFPRLALSVTSDLPLGAGLGSSASFCVCIASALLTLKGSIPSVYKGEWLSEDDRKLIKQWSFLGEMVVHGKPSGVDNCVITYGKALEFKNGQMQSVEDMPSLRIIIINTRVSRSSKQMVAAVADRHHKYPQVMESLMQTCDALTSQALTCLRTIHRKQAGKGADDDCLQASGDDDDCLQLYSSLNEMVRMAQDLLRCMGVSHVAIEEVLQVLHQHALVGKLTGAGGGGCVFAVLPPDFSEDSLEKLREELEERNFECLEACIGGNGVKISIE